MLEIKTLRPFPRITDFETLGGKSEIWMLVKPPDWGWMLKLNNHCNKGQCHMLGTEATRKYMEGVSKIIPQEIEFK